MSQSDCLVRAVTRGDDFTLDGGPPNLSWSYLRTIPIQQGKVVHFELGSPVPPTKLSSKSNRINTFYHSWLAFGYFRWFL